MTDVACFCWLLLLLFDAPAAACPRCGEVATVTAGLALKTRDGASRRCSSAVSSRAAGPLPARSRT